MLKEDDFQGGKEEQAQRAFLGKVGESMWLQLAANFQQEDLERVYKFYSKSSKALNAKRGLKTKGLLTRRQQSESW